MYVVVFLLMLKITGLIPARYGSSRFPGKPLVDIAGKSMIQRVYEQASKCNRLDDLAVVTDDERIADAVHHFGGKYFMTRNDHPSGTDRIGEVAAFLTDSDFFINIQGDEPLLHPESLNELCNHLDEHPETQIATLMKKIKQLQELLSPTTAKIIRDVDDNVLYFSRFPVPFVRDEPVREALPTNPVFYKHIGIYAYRRDILMQLVQLPVCELEETEKLEQLRWLYHGYKIKAVATEYESHAVDTAEDLKQVLTILRHSADLI